MSHAECLACGAKTVDLALDLGKTPPANRFVRSEDLGAVSEPEFALRVGVCGICGLAQLLDPVPPPLLFDEYSYMSSASSTLTEHLTGLAATIRSRLQLADDAQIVDVGCNDGTLLEGFRQAGISRRVGVDPAANLAPSARASGAEVVVGYFGPALAADLRRLYGPADVLTMTNTLPHVPDVHGLMQAVDALLADDGVFVVEFHYFGDLVDLCAFDTIYHEHVFYWSLNPLERLLAAHGLQVFDVERLTIHHGQIRAWITRAGARPVAERVSELRRQERQRGLGDVATLRALVPRMEAIRNELLGLIRSIRERGGRVAAYGAPAKGSTLLGFLGLGPRDIDYIADRNRLKQGRVTPGSHIPIVEPSQLLADRPELVIVLAWNFAEEIAKELRDYLRGGGRLVVPVPALRELEVPS